MLLPGRGQISSPTSLPTAVDLLQRWVSICQVRGSGAEQLMLNELLSLAADSESPDWALALDNGDLANVTSRDVMARRPEPPGRDATAIDCTDESNVSPSHSARPKKQVPVIVLPDNLPKRPSLISVTPATCRAAVAPPSAPPPATSSHHPISPTNRADGQSGGPDAAATTTEVPVLRIKHTGGDLPASPTPGSPKGFRVRVSSTSGGASPTAGMRHVAPESVSRAVAEVESTPDVTTTPVLDLMGRDVTTGSTVLHFAARWQLWKLLRCLCNLKLLLDPNAIDMRGQTVLHVICSMTCQGPSERNAVGKLVRRAAETAVTRGCDPSITDRQSRSPAHVAAIHGWWDTISYLCSRPETRRDINCRDVHGRTALHYVCLAPASLAEDNVLLSAVKALVDSGADVFLRDTDQSGPVTRNNLALHYAAVHGRLSIIDYMCFGLPKGRHLLGLLGLPPPLLEVCLRPHGDPTEPASDPRSDAEPELALPGVPAGRFVACKLLASFLAGAAGKTSPTSSSPRRHSHHQRTEPAERSGLSMSPRGPAMTPSPRRCVTSPTPGSSSPSQAHNPSSTSTWPETPTAPDPTRPGQSQCQNRNVIQGSQLQCRALVAETLCASFGLPKIRHVVASPCPFRRGGPGGLGDLYQFFCTNENAVANQRAPGSSSNGSAALPSSNETAALLTSNGRSKSPMSNGGAASARSNQGSWLLVPNRSRSRVLLGRRLPDHVYLSRDGWMHAALSSRLRHPNISAPIGHASRDGELYLLSEYYELGSLEDFLSGGRRWRHVQGEEARIAEVCLLVALQVCAGLGFLHSRGIIHGRLHARNVLLNDSSSDLSEHSGDPSIGLENAGERSQECSPERSHEPAVNCQLSRPSSAASVECSGERSAWLSRDTLNGCSLEPRGVGADSDSAAPLVLPLPAPRNSDLGSAKPRGPNRDVIGARSRTGWVTSHARGDSMSRSVDSALDSRDVTGCHGRPSASADHGQVRLKAQYLRGVTGRHRVDSGSGSSSTLGSHAAHGSSETLLRGAVTSPPLHLISAKLVDFGLRDFLCSLSYPPGIPLGDATRTSRDATMKSRDAFMVPGDPSMTSRDVTMTSLDLPRTSPIDSVSVTCRDLTRLSVALGPMSAKRDITDHVSLGGTNQIHSLRRVATDINALGDMAFLAGRTSRDLRFMSRDVTFMSRDDTGTTTNVTRPALPQEPQENSFAPNEWEPFQCQVAKDIAAFGDLLQWVGSMCPGVDLGPVCLLCRTGASLSEVQKTLLELRGSWGRRNGWA